MYESLKEEVKIYLKLATDIMRERDPVAYKDVKISISPLTIEIAKMIQIEKLEVFPYK